MNPLLGAITAAATRVGLHVRTIRADSQVCFPGATPPTAEAVDAAFGNAACIARSPEHWRFKLVPRLAKEKCIISHISRVFPLSRWLQCARRRFGDNASVFLSTDAPALARYSTSSKLQIATLPGDIGHISHSHLRSAQNRGQSDAAFIRAAADWYLLSLSTVILSPITSSFTQSVCTTRGMNCGVQFVIPTERDACVLDKCFNTSCRVCRWKLEYQGKRLRGDQL